MFKEWHSLMTLLEACYIFHYIPGWSQVCFCLYLYRLRLPSFRSARALVTPATLMTMKRSPYAYPPPRSVPRSLLISKSACTLYRNCVEYNYSIVKRPVHNTTSLLPQRWSSKGNNSKQVWSRSTVVPLAAPILICVTMQPCSAHTTVLCEWDMSCQMPGCYITSRIIGCLS